MKLILNIPCTTLLSPTHASAVCVVVWHFEGTLPFFCHAFPGESGHHWLWSRILRTVHYNYSKIIFTTRCLLPPKSTNVLSHPESSAVVSARVVGFHQLTTATDSARECISVLLTGEETISWRIPVVLRSPPLPQTFFHIWSLSSILNMRRAYKSQITPCISHTTPLAEMGNYVITLLVTQALKATSIFERHISLSNVLTEDATYGPSRRIWR